MKKFNNQQNEEVTLIDGRKVWLSRSVAVVGTIVLACDYGFYFLMVKRGQNCPDNIGKWVMPCGYLDWDETLQEAVEREVYEETGLDIIELIKSDSIKLLDKPWFIQSNPTGKQNVTLFYGLASNVKELPKLTLGSNTGECAETDWKTLDWLHKNKENIAFNHYDRILLFCKSYFGF